VRVSSARAILRARRYGKRGELCLQRVTGSIYRY
jgi:hypothetical protein